ncbi:lipoate--protein ligase family protein, partial [Pseudomonas syringae pv. tagetis]
MLFSIMVICVEKGLMCEKYLLASVCTGFTDNGLLFWRPNDRELFMQRRISRLPGFAEDSETLAD